MSDQTPAQDAPTNQVANYKLLHVYGDTTIDGILYVLAVVGTGAAWSVDSTGAIVGTAISSSGNVQATGDVIALNAMHAGNDIIAAGNVEAGNVLRSQQGIEVADQFSVDPAGNIGTAGQIAAGGDVIGHALRASTSVAVDGTDRIDATVYYDNAGRQVVGAQQAAIANATGFGDAATQLNLLLAAMRNHGLIAT